jgi:hypothetical protein
MFSSRQYFILEAAKPSPSHAFPELEPALSPGLVSISSEAANLTTTASLVSQAIAPAHTRLSLSNYYLELH